MKRAAGDAANPATARPGHVAALLAATPRSGPLLGATAGRRRRYLHRFGVLVSAALLAACQTIAPPMPPTVSVVALYQLPAEHALLDGIRHYEEADFEAADKLLRKSVGIGLADRRDAAAAHKYIAFIACAFSRLVECEASFRDAFAADPDFSLAEAEIGHPVWGPVYRRVAAEQPRK